MSVISESRLLLDAYQDARRKKGLIDFTQEMRTEKNDLSGKYSLTLARLSRLFSESVWFESPTKSGHRKLKNQVTGIVVEYANHGAKTVDPGAAETIFNSVQDHLNILNNEIFAYRRNNWKESPDFKASYARWSKFRGSSLSL